MASQGYGNISREEKEAFLKKKMEDMKKKSEEILRRHAEVEADKRNADMLSDMVSTKIHANPQTQSRSIVKNAKSTSQTPKEKSENSSRAKSRNSQQPSEENSHPVEWKHKKVSDDNVAPRHKETEYRKKLNEDDGPPPDPVNYLADPYRDGLFPEVDRSQDSRRHRSNYGGENFQNVKPVIQQRRNYERQHPPPPSSNNHLSMSVQMTGKERKEYENWKAERLKIDEERIARQKTSSGTWKREWDLNKTEQEEAAKKADKQFYKQPRWISESGDHHDQIKKNQGNKGQFNSSFEYRHHDKADRSVLINEHNMLTVVKSSDSAGEQKFDSHQQKNQGGRKVSEPKQSSSVTDERNFPNKKDSTWKQNEEKVSDMSKSDGWEEVDVEIGGARWDNESSVRTDAHPLQQTNNVDRERKATLRYSQKRNDSSWESRPFGNDMRRKSNSNVDFTDKQFLKRQNSSDKAQRVSDGWQAGRHNNSIRKYDGDWKDDGNWNKSRNDENKISDGWDNIDRVKKTHNVRSRAASDGWENLDKPRENLYRRSSDGDGSLDSSFYEHKQKYFERSRGGSFKNSNNRVFSSSEKGKEYLGNRKHDNTNQRAFAPSESRQFRDNKYAFKTDSPTADTTDRFDNKEGMGRSKFWRGNKREVQGRTYRGNSSRRNGSAYKPNLEGFDSKGDTERNELWRDGERGNYQGKTPRGRVSGRGNGNAYRGSRNSGQDYHKKNNNFYNSGKHDSSSLPLTDLNSKNLVGDGWEPNNEIQTPSVKWIEDDENAPSKDSEKSAAFTKPVECASSQDSSGPEGNKCLAAEADAESHDDSWEDVTSGCESELSDVGDEAANESNAPFCIESNVAGGEFGKDSKSILARYLGTDKVVESTNYSEGSDMDSSGVSKVPFISSSDSIEKILEDVSSVGKIPFISSNDSIEKILEEVYNDTIKSEPNKYMETTAQEQNEEVCDNHHTGAITKAQDTSNIENAMCEGVVASCSFSHTNSGLSAERVQSSEVCHGTDKGESKIVKEAEHVCEANSSLLDYTFDKEVNKTSLVDEGIVCEATAASSLDTEYSDKCNNVNDKDLPETPTSVCEDCGEIERIKNLSSKGENSLLANIENANSEGSDEPVVPAVEPSEDSSDIQLTDKEVKEDMEFGSEQNKLNQNTEMIQTSQLAQINADCKMPETEQDSSVSETIHLESKAEEMTEDKTSFVDEGMACELTTASSLDNECDNINNNDLPVTPSPVCEDCGEIEGSNNFSNKGETLERKATADNSSDVSLPRYPAEIPDDITRDSEEVSNEQTKSDLCDSISPTEDFDCNIQESPEDDFADSSDAFSISECKNESAKEYSTASCLPTELTVTENKTYSSTEDGIAEPCSISSNRKSEPLSEQTEESSQIKQSSSEQKRVVEENVINSSIDIAKCENMYSENTSEDKYRDLESADKLNTNHCLDTADDSQKLVMQPPQTVNVKEKSEDDASCDEYKVYSNSAHSSTPLLNKLTSSVSLHDMLPGISSENTVSDCGEPYLSTNEETSSCFFNCPVDNCNTASKTTDKLEENKEVERENAELPLQPSSQSDSVVPDSSLSTTDRNSLDLKNDSLPIIDSEKLSEVLPAVIHSRETKEQDLESDTSECYRSSTSKITDIKSLRDSLPRTVWKSSTTESTTEFTEVLEVITSIPQRILVQDSESTKITCKDEHSISKIESEQISDCPS